MKANVGGIDRALRIIFGLVLLALGIFVMKSGALMIIFVIIGAILFLTGLSRICCMYIPLGINTCSTKASKEETKQAG